ncbi:MAG: glycosyltransferase [Pseudomonadota bacterium]
MQADWQDFVARQEVLVALRFSYFGSSGWKSDFSKDKALLFDQDRLIMRLGLLQSLPLPSLAAQTDQNFHLMILSSHAMPRWAQRSLAEICAETLQPGQYTIIPRRFGVAHKHLAQFIAARYPENPEQTTPVLQTVLDDDDGFSTDLIATMRREMAELPPLSEAVDLRFVSFSRGYGIDLSSKNAERYGLYHHRYPFINLGLTMAGDRGGRNIFGIRHRKTPLDYPYRLTGGPPMFVRSVHEANDSRVEVSAKWRAVPDWRQDADVRTRFPYLPNL